VENENAQIVSRNHTWVRDAERKRLRECRRCRRPSRCQFQCTGRLAGRAFTPAATLVWFGPKENFTDNQGNTFTGSNAQSVVFTGGGQAGANYQVNDCLVVGIEATFDAMTHNNNSSDAIFIPAVKTSVKVSVTDSWLTTVAARVGLVAAERALFYAKGGGAWVGGNELTVTNINTVQ
jgi:opacity protein-like surface antigen